MGPPGLCFPQSNSVQNKGSRLSDTNFEVPDHCPVPPSLTVCGLVLALSTIDSIAGSVPVVVGAKVTLIVHLAAGARLVPQLLVWKYWFECRPAIAMFVMLSAVFRLFVTLTGLAMLFVPTGTTPKARLRGVTVTGSCPVPVNAIVWGLVLALSVIVTVPVCAPVATGANVTVMVQCPAAGIVAAHVLLCVKAVAPEMETLTPVNATGCWLVRVMGAAILFVPVATAPKLRVVAESATGGTPVPARLMLCGL